MVNIYWPAKSHPHPVGLPSGSRRGPQGWSQSWRLLRSQVEAHCLRWRLQRAHAQMALQLTRKKWEKRWDFSQETMVVDRNILGNCEIWSGRMWCHFFCVSVSRQNWKPERESEQPWNRCPPFRWFFFKAWSDWYTLNPIITWMFGLGLHNFKFVFLESHD